MRDWRHPASVRRSVLDVAGAAVAARPRCRIRQQGPLWSCRGTRSSRRRGVVSRATARAAAPCRDSSTARLLRRCKRVGAAHCGRGAVHGTIANDTRQRNATRATVQCVSAARWRDAAAGLVAALRLSGCPAARPAVQWRPRVGVQCIQRKQCFLGCDNACRASCRRRGTSRARVAGSSAYVPSAVQQSRRHPQRPGCGRSAGAAVAVAWQPCRCACSGCGQ